jgi:DNA-binding CsgD family transcriptional regulator
MNQEVFPLTLLDELRRAWKQLLGAEEMRGAAIEDISRPGRRPICGFGATVFVADDYVANLLLNPKPYTLSRVVLGLGGPCGLLSYSGIAKANAAAGLNLAVVHHGWSRSVPEPEFHVLARELEQSFHESHSGFRIRELLQEVYGPFERDWALASGGWRQRSDYTDYYLKSPEPLPPEDRYPYLLGSTRQEALAGTIISAIFAWQRPLLGLSRRQQQVLEAASEGLGNPAIAQRLCMSPGAVRNSFRLAYEKVESHPSLCSLFEPHEDIPRELVGKREILVNYVREHREELRPWKP